MKSRSNTPMNKAPLAIVSATSDLVTDQRVHRTCLQLQSQGFDVILVGRQLGSSLQVAERPYGVYRFKLWFEKGPLFYAAYNFRLFFFLLFKKADLLFSNDLDTLPANYLASLMRRNLLVYDSHEYFTGVPELENRPAVKQVWESVEKFIFPRLKIIITVNDSIAGIYSKKYNKKIIVVRNVPVKLVPEKRNFDIELQKKKLGLPAGKKLLILQGSGINVQRGAEEALLAMEFVENMILILLGGGDVMADLKKLADKKRLTDKVIFLPRMPYESMMEYTMISDLGFTFDKDLSLNYRYSLPNKIFDYIHAGIPVLSSRLPELEKIITTYDVGTFIPSHDPKAIAAVINQVFSDSVSYARWKNNTARAAMELNWNEESKKFPDLIHELKK